ncbi:sirohydrochlorin chelatase [Hydromonas duriensis]|uniref:Sirohydrochlorin cobaltochelatase n=1 Tax=Hydromonas duriensis TaxID=1527608 RepID=A0A4R6Y2J9_9BURK|nr:CbiX/SirB N-terminal domain-containing protein [Hydromonas duriensis]TDR30733.1 sirohydrochlorin cobaltochelatase [Hydromonas duriensis]
MSNINTNKRALILFAHGSRQSGWREPFERVAQRLEQQNIDAQVELAFLEFMHPTLSESLENVITQGIHHITIVPMFFGVGNHVARDLDELIQAVKQKHPYIQLSVAPAVGQSDNVIQAMASYAASFTR